jgi:uncharacterized repeat protein (TIGR03803 family)
MKAKLTQSLLLFLSMFSFAFETKSQIVLYGLGGGGGIYNSGTVYSVTPSGLLKRFASLSVLYAESPTGGLLYASDGNFYASSLFGGYGDSCAIFKCSSTGSISNVINLDTVWGSSTPQGNNLIQALDGNLYGMTTAGGTYFGGVIYKLTLSGHYSAIHFFDKTNGSSPYGSLIQSSDSML